MNPFDRKYNINFSFFEKIDTQEKAYILGFLYADGYNKFNRYFRVKLHKKDEDILFKMLKAMDATYPVVNYYKRAKQTDGSITETIHRGFQVSSRKMTKDLHNLGCIQCKGDFIRFPFWLDKSLWSHFIRGYFDGDGGIMVLHKKAATKIYMAHIASNPNFIKDLNVIFKEEFGREFHVEKYKDSERVEQIRFGGYFNTLNFLDFIYKNASIYLNRKYNLYLEVKNRKTIREKSISVFDIKTNQKIQTFKYFNEIDRFFNFYHGCARLNVRDGKQYKNYKFIFDN